MISLKILVRFPTWLRTKLSIYVQPNVSPTFVFFVFVFLNVLLKQYILGIKCLVLDVLLGGNNVAVKLPLQFKIFLYKLAEMILLP